MTQQTQILSMKILNNSIRNNRNLLKHPHDSFLKTDQIRKLFTKHGLHHNRLGKQYFFHQIASMVYYLFEQKTTYPIRLGWNIPNCAISEDKSLKRVTTRNRKLPVTRSKDILW